MRLAESRYVCCQNARLAGPKFVCKDGVFSHAAVPSGYRCAIPVLRVSSPFPNSILKDTATSMPYDFSAARKLLVQSRAARFIRGLAAKSVRQMIPFGLSAGQSSPPANARPLVCAVNPLLLVFTEIVSPFP